MNILSGPITDDNLDSQEYLVSDNCSLVGRFNDNLGYLFDSVIVDDILYVMSYTGLYIFNNSNPIYPELINQIGASRVYQIAFKDDILFLTTNLNGLLMYNVSNPRDLKEVYHYYNVTAIGSGHVASISIQGDFAYYANQKEGLVIFDISNITKPILVGRFPDRDYIRVTASGNFAYLSLQSDNAIEVVNVTDPTNPTNITKYIVSNTVTRIVIESNIAYLATEFGGLQILNFTDPENITKIGEFFDGGASHDVQIVNDVAFLTDYDEGLEIIDIANLSAPSLISKYGVYENYNGIFVIDNVVYLSNYYVGIELIDISNLENPFRFQRIPIGGFSYNVRVKGDIAYVCDSGQGIEIIDIKDPSKPTRMSIYQATPNMYGYDIEIQGDIGFIGDIFNGIFVVDLSDQTYPVLLGNAITSVYDFAVAGDYLYVSIGTGLRIFDVSDLTNPTSVSFFSIPGYANHIEIYGDLAFISTSTNGILVYDISNPQTPQEVVIWNDLFWVHSVDIEDDVIYVNYPGGLEIYDISDILNPVHLGSLDNPKVKSDIYLYGDYLFVSQLTDGVIIIDVSDLTNPKQVGQFNFGGIYYDFDYYDTFLYLSAFGNGLEIVTGPFFPKITTTTNVDISLTTITSFVPIVLIPIILKKRKRK
ncbi:MAG: LVIVD repeat-containing protein [Candidatus Heimdallarchaeota archaeon]